MALLDNILSLIDMRSFSSVWFWIVVALFWSTVTHNVLGVSYDMIVQARKKGGQTLEDVQVLVEIHVRRMLSMVRNVGHWMLGFVTATMSLIFVLAFGYGLELAQALFLLLLPLTIIRLMALRLAFRVERERLAADRLLRALLRHRLWVQLLGVVIIFLTAIWGMLRVMSASVLSV
ncbi:component of SufBCD complex [Roseinatronobacter alkalisoli]|uniref:Component of SufBCD complex n=1 Tax=Roseinatronobacter alkalisoli TaxID=3028235 RepID=A0ABT5T4Y2_9RHOB|nr:component of SufBCD complex [Roseinatronobacter sp. HJB301]MDD7970181.1 component of SufBCD complex [Roseinatronobacter sp. HJB301]